MSTFGINASSRSWSEPGSDGNNFATDARTRQPASTAPLSPDGVPADTRVAEVARKGGLHKKRPEDFFETRTVDFDEKQRVRFFEELNEERMEPLQLPNAHAINTPLISLTDLPEGSTLLHLAVYMRDILTLQALVLEGEPDRVNAADVYSMTALRLAVHCGLRQSVKHLIIQGHADVNMAYPPMSNTVLHEAAEQGNVKMVANLVDCGAKIKQTNAADETPLDVAKRAQQWKICKWLFEEEQRSVALAAMHSRQETPVDMWPPHLQIDKAETDTQLGSSLPATSRGVRSVLSRADWIHQVVWPNLYAAAYSGQMEHLVEQLRRYPECLYIYDPNSGDTLLHAAACGGRYQVAEHLVRIAKPEMLSRENNEGETPWQVAKKANHSKLSDLLQKEGL